MNTDGWRERSTAKTQRAGRCEPRGSGTEKSLLGCPLVDGRHLAQATVAGAVQPEEAGSAGKPVPGTTVDAALALVERTAEQARLGAARGVQQFQGHRTLGENAKVTVARSLIWSGETSNRPSPGTGRPASPRPTLFGSTRLVSIVPSSRGRSGTSCLVSVKAIRSFAPSAEVAAVRGRLSRRTAPRSGEQFAACNPQTRPSSAARPVRRCRTRPCESWPGPAAPPARVVRFQ